MRLFGSREAYKLVFILTILLAAVPVCAQVGVGTVGSGTATNASQVTFGLTVSASDPYIVAVLGITLAQAGSRTGSCTWNGTEPMNQLHATGNTFSWLQYIYFDLVPNSTGAHNVVCNIDGQQNIYAIAVPFSGVNGSTPSHNPNYDIGTSNVFISRNVQSASGELVLSLFGWSVDGPTIGENGTQAYKNSWNDSGYNIGQAVGTWAGAASVTAGWTPSANTDYSHATLSVIPAGGGGGGILHRVIRP